MRPRYGKSYIAYALALAAATVAASQLPPAPPQVRVWVDDKLPTDPRKERNRRKAERKNARRKKGRGRN